MDMWTTIEKKSLGLATAQQTALRGKFDHQDAWFDAFLAIEAHVEEDAPLPDEIQMLAEDEAKESGWPDVHAVIQEEARAIEAVIKDCLELAKEGIADATIECEIDSDVYTYDMPGFVDRGASLE